MIPKNFHRIWLGGQPMPQVFVDWGQTWIQHHPDWTMRTWTEGDLPELEDRALIETLFPRCISLSQRSNVYRYAILRQLGGVYLDTDFECLKAIDPLIHDARLFAAWEPIDRLLIATGIVGAEPRHELFRDLLDGASDLRLQDPQSAGPRYFSAGVFSRGMGDMRAFEARLFYPYTRLERNRRTETFPEAYGAHHWSSIWHQPTSAELPVLR